MNDPGGLIAAAVAAGAPTTVLPGPSAVETALVASGLVGDRYQFVGYLPRRDAELRALAGELVSWQWPVVGFESPRRLPRSLAALAAEMPDRQAAVCRELTKRFEGDPSAPLGELAARFEAAPRRDHGRARRRRSDGEVDVGDALAAVAELVAAGLSRRPAVDLVARLTGASKNVLYRGSL